jgi:hypothetical protein
MLVNETKSIFRFSAYRNVKSISVSKPRGSERREDPGWVFIPHTRGPADTRGVDRVALHPGGRSAATTPGVSLIPHTWGPADTPGVDTEATLLSSLQHCRSSESTWEKEEGSWNRLVGP